MANHKKRNRKSKLKKIRESTGKRLTKLRLDWVLLPIGGVVGKSFFVNRDPF